MTATHGLASTYRDSRYRCRCESCCAANTARARAERAERVRRIKEDPTLAQHGTCSTYTNWGCRCSECVAAAVEANAAAYRRRAAS